MSSTTHNDALGYVDDLREAILSPFMQLLLPTESNVGSSLVAARWEASLRVAEQTSEVRDTAVTVISALGFCRIYGIALPLDLKTRLTSPLPIELLAPAISGMLRLLESSTDDARALPSRFDNSELLEDRSHCTSILHSLMELWAMYIVVDDEYEHSLGESNDLSYGAWMHRLLDAYSALDAEVQRDEQIRLLSVATELPLLDNWRKMLADPYREYLPWWLDGTLETAALEVRDFINADRTFKFATTRPISNALVMLAKRNQEISTRAATVVLAASAGENSSPTAKSLLHRTWPIVGDQVVQVRLELREEQTGKRLFIIALVGAVEWIMKYSFVEIGFHSAPEREASFQLGWASLPLDASEIDEIMSLVIVDDDGNRRKVNLEGLSNGT